jgi:putative phosphoribosyl transferase
MRLRAEEKQELKRRELAYRGSYSELEVRGKAVILIDDGIATGSTVRAAVRALNAQHPARFNVAVPTPPTPSTANCDRDG